MRSLRLAHDIGPARRNVTNSIVRFAGYAVGVCVILGLIATAGIGQAQTGFTQSGSLKRSPAEIVKRYVRLDQKGARLEAMGFDVLAPYVDWKEEPSWDQVVVIQEAIVPEDYRQWTIIDNLDIIIPVTFRVRGSVNFKSAVFVPEEKTEEVRFHVKAVRNNWRIVEPVIPPHIGVPRMVNFAREAALREQDAAQRGILTALEGSLRKAK
ncbi:MAG: hypothetical protein HP491_03220 [Nitrospira sp.]|nr:hypothetical protein [Nitrospira sp.]MBH0181811.1 hypothetical protein [Nitrospira sp.]MBH0186734.1 hypothetical protein [Nitrospira sp.]MBH0189016.1 hypothetical protein [Nitrospira sp.]